MGKRMRCLKCGAVIETGIYTNVFKYCNCMNIFIDGGGIFSKYGGEGLKDGSAEIWEDGKWVSTGKMRNEYGVAGNTKIGLLRNDPFTDPTFLEIKDENIVDRYVWCFKIGVGFVPKKILSVKKIDTDFELYKYYFQNNCGRGKSSFGTEDFLISTQNQYVLLSNECEKPIDLITSKDNVLELDRNLFREILNPCSATFIMSARYMVDEFKSLFDEGVYTICLDDSDCYYTANGFFVKGFYE